MTGRGNAVHAESTHQAGVAHRTGEIERIVLRSTQNSCSICRRGHQGVRTLSKRDHAAKAAAKQHTVVAATAIDLTGDHRSGNAHEVSASTGVDRAVRD